MYTIKDFLFNLYLSIKLYFIIKYKKNKNIEIVRDNYELTFIDEFSGDKLDLNKWRTDSYYGLRFHPGNIILGKAPDVYYSEHYNLINNNCLVQLATNCPKEIKYIDWDGVNHGNWTIPYRIGQIDSSNSFEQKYGYFEIRSKCTDQPGSWPAFWLATVDSWPPEIDIYEIYTGSKNGSHKFNSNFHWNDKKRKHKSKVQSHYTSSVSDDFHIYALEWTDKHFKIYYDNILVRVLTSPKILKAFDKAMHIIINNGIHIEQSADKAIYPTEHIVDYVKVYKKIIS